MVLELVAEGTLSGELVGGLAAALVQTRQPGPVAEGARIAAGLGDAKYARLLQAALEALDIGVLLHIDPVLPDQSVEDALLTGMTAVADVTDTEVRADLLTRLRNAGLILAELDILLRAGSPEELRWLLPSVLAEGIPEGGRQSLKDAATRDDIRAALQRCLPELPAGVQQEIQALAGLD